MIKYKIFFEKNSFFDAMEEVKDWINKSKVEVISISHSQTDFDLPYKVVIWYKLKEN